MVALGGIQLSQLVVGGWWLHDNPRVNVDVVDNWDEV